MGKIGKGSHTTRGSCGQSALERAAPGRPGGGNDRAAVAGAQIAELVLDPNGGLLRKSNAGRGRGGRLRQNR